MRCTPGTEPRLLPGIGLINCVYLNQKLDQFWVIDYRIYEPLGDGKSNLEHVADIIYDLVNFQQLPFATVRHG